MGQPRPLVNGLDRVLASLGAPTVDAIIGVMDAWPDVVGADLASHCTARSIEHGRLVVTVDDPAWADRLLWSERQVLTRLDAVVGAGVVDHLDVRVRRS